MNKTQSASIQKVRQAILDKGYDFQILELPDSTRSAQEAADSIGCSVSEIAKSLVFKGKESGKPVLIIASGTNRVSPGKVEKLFDEAIMKADADYIRSETGFAIGGIPPVGHKHILQTFIDEELLQYDTIWAAAGTPFSVFSMKSKDLPDLTDGTISDIKQ